MYVFNAGKDTTLPFKKFKQLYCKQLLQYQQNEQPFLTKPPPRNIAFEMLVLAWCIHNSIFIWLLF